MSAAAGGPVPAEVSAAGAVVTIERAWPSDRLTAVGEPVMRFEGTDEDGRLRAGRLIVTAGGGGASVSAALADYGRDRALPDLADALADDGELVVHRLGRRAVVRRCDRYVKVLRPGRASDSVLERTRTGSALATAAGVRAPEILAVADGRMDLSVLGGVGLHDSGGSMDLAQWRAAWDAWAAAWACLADSGTPTPGHGAAATRAGDAALPAHTAADELAALHDWLGHTTRFATLPHLVGELRRRCAALADTFAASRPDPLVVSHRDLHDKQLLWDGDAIGLLDLDTMARAEAACDLANLAVHAELRTAQGLWSRAHREVVLDRVTGVAGELDVSGQRLTAYAEATRLRLTMLYAFRPRWAPLMGAWLRERTLIAVSSS